MPGGGGEPLGEPRRAGARRILSSTVGSEPLGKFSTLPDSSIAYQEWVLTRSDRLCPVLTMELLQFYYSRLHAQLGK